MKKRKLSEEDLIFDQAHFANLLLLRSVESRLIVDSVKMKKKSLQNPNRLGKPNVNVLTEAQRKEYAAALGRIGGAKSSPAKAEAARRNGKLGGRPKKVLGKGGPKKSK